MSEAVLSAARRGVRCRSVLNTSTPGSDSSSLPHADERPVSARDPGQDSGVQSSGMPSSLPGIITKGGRSMILRQVTVLDAADVEAESAFWAGMIGGRVFGDDQFQCVIDEAGNWPIGVQHAPAHVQPQWPEGAPQQVHIDLHVTDAAQAHEQAMRLGARLLQAAPDLGSEEGHQVYADPAGHPFCIGWGHPSQEAIAAFVAQSSD
jgi:hypothetical protein